MKKMLIPILLVAAILLSSCGGQATPTPQLAAGGAPVELTFMMWGAPEELAVWNQIVQDFQTQNPAIKVNVEVSDWDAYWEKLKTMLAASTPPDLFAMDAPLYLDYQSRGVLMNLQPYLDSNPDLLKDVYPQTLQAYQTPDGYFGLPRDFQTIVLFYNKDMFDAANVPYPTDDWTYDDLRAAAKQLTKDTTGDGKIDQYGFYSDLWDMELVWSEAIWAYGGDIISADHTKTLIGEPKAREAWQLFDDMMFTDKSMPDTTTAAQFGGDPFQAGAAAMTTIGHWAVPGYNTVTFKWDVAPMPAGPAGKATSVNSAGFVLAQGSKHPEEAFEFIKFVLSTAGQTRLAQLGFAVPVLKSVADSSAFLEQPGSTIDQKIFIDSLAFAHMKPVFKGYDEWSAAVGDGMADVWTGQKELGPTLDEVVPAADEVLAKNQ
jgi:multiple sugar transport system substrate-binding protein